MFKFILKEKINELPTTSGVYAFKSKKAHLYIGKAINIKERVKNHFANQNFKDNIFIPQTTHIGYIATGSEIKALILEAELIKKFQPKYNTVWRDSKSYHFVFITNEKFPRVFAGHKVKMRDAKLKMKETEIIGPFIDSKALKQTLRVLRRVFPYRTCNKMPKKPCLYKELNLCPAPCETNTIVRNYRDRTNYVITEKLKKECRKNVQNLIKILQGKKTQVLKDLQKKCIRPAKNRTLKKPKL